MWGVESLKAGRPHRLPNSACHEGRAFLAVNQKTPFTMTDAPLPMLPSTPIPYRSRPHLRNTIGTYLTTRPIDASCLLDTRPLAAAERSEVAVSTESARARPLARRAATTTTMPLAPGIGWLAG